MSNKVLTSEGLKEINNDDYMSLMTGVAMQTQAIGAASISSPTGRRMLARNSAGLIRHNALMLEASSGIAHRIVTEPVKAAMLAGFTVVADNPDDAKRVTDLFDSWDVWGTVKKAACAKRSDGHSIIVMGENFVRYHPGHSVNESTDWYLDYNSPFFGLPVGWRVTLKSPIGGEVYIPQQDSILLGDDQYDSIVAMGGRFFGESVLARPYAALERLGLSHELIISILSLSVQDIYKRTDLADDLKTPAGEAKAARRLGGIAATRQLNDMIAIDAEEEITRLQSQLTGVADILDIAIRIVSAESGIPVSVLANKSSGISNNDDSGDDVWLRLVEGINTEDITPTLQKLAFRYLGVSAKFVANKSQGDIRRDAEVDKLHAETAKMYYDMRAISSEEVRGKVSEDAVVPLLSANLPSSDDGGDEERGNEAES